MVSMLEDKVFVREGFTVIFSIFCFRMVVPFFTRRVRQVN